MTTVHVSDDKASSAIEWCAANVPHLEWDVNHRWPGQGYQFKFDDVKIATFFSLKWAGPV